MPDQLETALAALARATYEPVDISVSGCTYCYDSESLTALAGPVDRVSDDLIASVAFEVPDHWDDFPAVYRKFVARILDALANDTLNVDEEAVAARLTQAGCWASWPQHQSSAVLNVLNALLVVTMTTYPRRPDLDTCLRLLAATPQPFSHSLSLVGNSDGVAADQHLLALHQSWLRDSNDGVLVFGWDRDWVVPRQAFDWLDDQLEQRGLTGR